MKTKPDIETLDSVYQHIGNFGRIQKQAVVFCVFACISIAYQNICPVFTLNTPHHRCRIAHLPNDSYRLQDSRHVDDVETFIPLDVDGNYKKCVVWKYDDNDNATSRHKVKCSSWVYDDKVYTRTLAIELNLVCDKKLLRSTANMLLFLGKLVGAIIQGIASDRFGRRRCIFVSTLGMFACTIGNGFVNSIPLLFAFRFLSGATTTATYLLSFVLSVELMDPSNRTIIGSVMKLGIAAGYLTMVALAYKLRDWQQLQFALVWPAAVSVIGLGFTVESPRWLLSKKKDQRAYDVLRRMAKINRTELPESKLARLIIVEEKQKESPISLFRVPCLVIRWFILYFNWIVIVAVYYGLTWNVSNMSGNIFLNFTLLAIVELCGTLLASLMVNRLSRKYFHVCAMMVSGLVLASTFVPVITFGPDWVVIFLSMVGKFTISVAFYLVYVYSAELFPTTYRSFGMGSCSTAGRLGGIASPYVADLSFFVDGPFGQVLPQVVCGVAGILGGLSALYLPETRGRPLPETIEDAKNFTHRHKIPSDDKLLEEDHNFVPLQGRQTVN